MAACTLQQQHLQHIASHLPSYLPSLRSPEVAGPPAASRGAAKENSRGTTNAAAAAAGGGAPKKRAPAPRRCVEAVVVSEEGTPGHHCFLSPNRTDASVSSVTPRHPACTHLRLRSNSAAAGTSQGTSCPACHPTCAAA